MISAWLTALQLAETSWVFVQLVAYINHLGASLRRATSELAAARKELGAAVTRAAHQKACAREAAAESAALRRGAGEVMAAYARLGVPFAADAFALLLAIDDSHGRRLLAEMMSANERTNDAEIALADVLARLAAHGAAPTPVACANCDAPTSRTFAVTTEIDASLCFRCACNPAVTIESLAARATERTLAATRPALSLVDAVREAGAEVADVDGEDDDAACVDCNMEIDTAVRGYSYDPEEMLYRCSGCTVEALEENADRVARKPVTAAEAEERFLASMASPPPAPSPEDVKAWGAVFEAAAVRTPPTAAPWAAEHAAARELFIAGAPAEIAPWTPRAAGGAEL